MRKTLVAAAAAIGFLGAPIGAHAVTYTGTVDGIVSEYLPITPFDFDPRPLRVTFAADMTKFDSAFLSFSSDLYFEGTFDMGPGQPREWYGDSYELYDDYTPFLTPTGFSITIDTPDNLWCNPYKPPAYFCEHVYPVGFYLDGEAVGPVAYTYTVTAIPEPATWAMLIAGFGLAGAALRGAQRRKLRALA